jgi:hypothetical protein
MRRRFVYDPTSKELVEVSAARSQALHFIQPDLPGYHSPVTGKWVEGRKARREDLLRTGSRPWEGREAELKEAARANAGKERQLDQLAEKMAHRAWDMAPERVRKVFRSR